MVFEQKTKPKEYMLFELLMTNYSQNFFDNNDIWWFQSVRFRFHARCPLLVMPTMFLATEFESDLQRPRHTKFYLVASKFDGKLLTYGQIWHTALALLLKLHSTQKCHTVFFLFTQFCYFNSVLHNEYSMANKNAEPFSNTMHLFIKNDACEPIEKSIQMLHWKYALSMNSFGVCAYCVWFRSSETKMNKNNAKNKNSLKWKNRQQERERSCHNFRRKQMRQWFLFCETETAK